jgi:hypothetical protein
MGHGREGSEQCRGITITALRFPRYKGIRRDSQFPLVDAGPEFPDDSCLLQVQYPVHYFVTAEAQVFSDLIKGGRDKREAAFQFPEQVNISLIQRYAPGAVRVKKRTAHQF